MMNMPSGLRMLSRFELVLVMSLLLVVIFPFGAWYSRLPMGLAAVAALLVPSLRRDARLWLGIFLCAGLGVWNSWYSIDNHKFLLCYWCLAITCSLYASSPERVLARSSRHLVGLCFLFAAFWKFYAPGGGFDVDYATGGFFEFELLTDPRFKNLSSLVGGIDDAAMHQNKQSISALMSFDSTATQVPMSSSPQVEWLALFMCWEGFLIESLIGLSFLWPGESGLARWRDYFLLFFVITTYALVPVFGFAWTVLIMGLASHHEKLPFPRYAYIGVFLLVYIYQFPWLHMGDNLGLVS